MLKVGDKVRINVGAIVGSRYVTQNIDYIKNNPDKVYSVEQIDRTNSRVCIGLDDAVLRDTAFFENELVVEDAKLNKEDVLRFFFEDVNGLGENVDIFVLIPELTVSRITIMDAIQSYVDSVEDWQYEDLVSDVLSSFGLQYTIIDPITFNI